MSWQNVEPRTGKMLKSKLGTASVRKQGIIRLGPLFKVEPHSLRISMPESGFEPAISWLADETLNTR